LILIKRLEIFLKLNGYFISPTEINHLIFRLDKDGDGRITFTEFEEIFFLNDSVTNVQQDESFFTKSYNKRLEDNSGKYNNLLRGSYNDLNLRASMRTYTSPVRERRINYSQDLASLSLSKNMTSQERIISPLRESVNTSQNIQSLSLRNSYTYGKSNNLSNSLRISKPNFYTKSDLLSSTFENASNTRSSTLRTSSQPKDDLGYYLFKYFKDVIELEINLEGNKERFSLQPDVTVSNLYKIFDKEFCGSISMFQMRDNLLGLDVFVNIDEVKLLFKRYNSSNSGKFRYNMKNNISYNDFSEMILPQKYEYSKLIQRREISSTSSLSYDTRFKFSNLLKTIIENEKNVELFRKLLNANIFFNSIKAFNLIKPKYRDYITITDLQLFFRMNSVNVLGAEVELLFRRLDKNRDGVVSCQEVMNNLKLVPSRNPILEQIPK
jgi:Ca2+-binding EF-hand superfamily protein